jgi:hypothetical protein
MHTVMVVAVGLLLVGACALAGRIIGGTPGAATAMLAFLPLWLIGAGVNMYVGVKRLATRVFS